MSLAIVQITMFYHDLINLSEVLKVDWEGFVLFKNGLFLAFQCFLFYVNNIGCLCLIRIL